MPNNNKKLAGAALTILKLVRGKLGTGGVIGLVIAAVLYVAVIQPVVEKKFGIALPTIGDTEPSTASTPSSEPSKPSKPSNPSRPSQPRSPSQPQKTKATSVEPGDLTDVLTEVGRGVYRSPAGLRYTRGSQQGHRLKHVMAHAVDDPDRAGQHGVFDTDDPREVVLLVDEAYEQALAGRDTRARREDARMVYEVDLGRRIGYVGGQSGNRQGKPAVDHVRLVVQEDRLITAFPFRP